MKQHIKSYAGRIASSLQHVGADIDPEILQLPGGGVIATVLWLYARGSVALRKRKSAAPM